MIQLIMQTTEYIFYFLKFNNILFLFCIYRTIWQFIQGALESIQYTKLVKT